MRLKGRQHNTVIGSGRTVKQAFKSVKIDSIDRKAAKPRSMWDAQEKILEDYCKERGLKEVIDQNEIR